MTETNGSVCVASEAEIKNRPGTSGRVLPSVEIKIKNGSGEELGAGQEGRVFVKGAMNMREYFGNRAATTQAIEDNWFNTQDIGYIDEARYLYIVDREKDIVRIGETSYSLTEIECALEELPFIDEVAVVVKSIDQQEALVVAVVPVPGSQVETLAIFHNVKRFGNLPTGISVQLFGALPRNASGKLDRNKLESAVA
jgi:acyl-CoA synthetase (AMP-forming)/AMP-acid ligase II